jgi:RND superfamily putative drug exporter
MMRFFNYHHLVSRRPISVVVAWLLAATAVGLTAPSLTRLAAEGQANLLPRDAESVRVAAIVGRAWPGQAYQSMAVVALERPGKLTADDHRFARSLAEIASNTDRPRDVLGVMGPTSAPEVAERLVSRDGTMQLVAFPIADSFVSPATHRAVAWLQDQAAALARRRPPGLDPRWTGDAVIGGDYMHNVEQSLNRAAVATVGLLLIILLLVYRSVLVALVPLATIGISLVVARGVLGWLATAGWEVSPLVELFLVVLLFGSGTDFCLFLAWRFGEHWNAADPAAAMEETLLGTRRALLTSAGTVIAGLSLMAATRFKLFSSTGPSVALGLAITLVAALTLTPALLLLLARHRPRAFAGLSHAHASNVFWDQLAHEALKRPLLTWLATLAVMVPPAILGLGTNYIQDTLTEMPPGTASVQTLRAVAARFGQGFLAPLTIVLESHDRDGDLKQSEGLALIDDASRFLGQSRRLHEVRSATQPVGSTALLDPARISARLSAVDRGFDKMADGASQLHDGLIKGVAKIRLAIMMESMLKGRMGAPAPGSNAKPSGGAEGSQGAPAPAGSGSGSEPGSGSPTSHRLPATVHQTAATLDGVRDRVDKAATKQTEAALHPAAPASQDTDPRQTLIHELARAAEGAGQIAAGAQRAGEAVAEILEDPVGRHTLDRLLISPRTVREHPDLLKSFAAYISPDGKRARIDVIQDEPMSSEAAMDQVVDLRRRLAEYLGESRWLKVSAGFSGANATSADIRQLTRSDQHRTWLIVPAGVFVVLMLALRDPFACLNLVATMILTYAFALGITHAVFVTFLGDAGLDWKVPYFLFVLLVAVGVDYNVFLMARLHEESRLHGLYAGIRKAVAATGGLITSAAAITACSFASLLLSPLSSLRQLGFALVVGVTVDAVLVRPVLVPCGHWLMKRRIERARDSVLLPPQEVVTAEAIA